MSVWVDAKKELPPLEEEVLILFKDKKDKLTYNKLFYAVARRVVDRFFGETWSRYTEYQGYYEVVYWAKLYDMPRLRSK